MTFKVNNNMGVVFAIDRQTGLPFRCIMYCNGFDVEKTKERVLKGRQDYTKVLSILNELNYNYKAVGVNIDPKEWQQKRSLIIETAKKIAEKLESEQKND